MKTNVIHIEITGPVGTGKSSLMGSIKALLEQHGYCVAIPCRTERHDIKTTIENGKSHQIPPRDSTVIILLEHTQPVHGEHK